MESSERVVCVCRGLTVGDVQAAADLLCRPVGWVALSRVTGAGRGPGSCGSCVAAVLDAAGGLTDRPAGGTVVE